MQLDIQEIYQKTILPLPEKDKLKLASLILEKVTRKSEGAKSTILEASVTEDSRNATEIISSDKIQGDESVLMKEYAEINQYIRLNCQLGLAWYTFFITGNLIAVGWLISDAIKENKIPLSYFIIILIPFILVNGLGIYCCRYGILNLQQSHNRLVAILADVKGASYSKVHLCSPCPDLLYIGLIKLAKLSLYVVAGFQLLLLVLHIVVQLRH
jgi:hypothetical protein